MKVSLSLLVFVHLIFYNEYFYDTVGVLQNLILDVKGVFPMYMSSGILLSCKKTCSCPQAITQQLFQRILPRAV